MLPFLLLACTPSGGLSLSDTIESGVPDSHINESRVPDSRLADTQKAGDSEAVDAPRTTTYSCAGKGNYTYVTDINVNIDGKPPNFVVWYHVSVEYRQYVEAALGQSYPPVFMQHMSGSLSDDGFLKLECQTVEGIDFVDQFVVVDW